MTTVFYYQRKNIMFMYELFIFISDGFFHVLFLLC